MLRPTPFRARGTCRLCGKPIVFLKTFEGHEWVHAQGGMFCDPELLSTASPESDGAVWTFDEERA